MTEEKIGEVVKFFAKPSVAAVKIMDGELKTGDEVKFIGHTTELISTINSMEINNKEGEKAVVGETILALRSLLVSVPETRYLNFFSRIPIFNAMN